MSKIVFIIGGSRSGKSSYALNLANAEKGWKKHFIATCVPFDDEMKSRVLAHQNERGKDWITIESPVFLPEMILETSIESDVILIDCLTLWINNLMMEDKEDKEINFSILKLTEILQSIKCPIFIVSNEIGSGIVPENKLARRFRDLIGLLNQKVAFCSNQVIYMIAGIPLGVKKDF